MEEAWLIGRYIADGYVNDSLKNKGSNHRNSRAIFTIGTHKLDYFLSKLKTYHPCIVNYGTCTRIDICSKRLKQLCEICGRVAYSKEIPKVYLDLPIDLLSELIEGYISGDGCIHKTSGLNTACTISPKLVVSFQMAMHKVKQIPVKIYCQKRVGTTRIIQGKTVGNLHDLFELTWLNDIPRQSLAVKLDGYIWQPFKKLECVEGPIEIYNSTSSLVNGILVKNL